MPVADDIAMNLAFRDITFEVQSGKGIGLLGPSGSGKSTLLNVIGCIVEPGNGRMHLDGEAALTGSRELVNHFNQDWQPTQGGKI